MTLINLVCPQCHARFPSTGALVPGKVVRCARCMRIFQIPGPTPDGSGSGTVAASDGPSSGAIPVPPPANGNPRAPGPAAPLKPTIAPATPPPSAAPGSFTAKGSSPFIPRLGPAAASARPAAAPPPAADVSSGEIPAPPARAPEPPPEPEPEPAPILIAEPPPPEPKAEAPSVEVKAVAVAEAIAEPQRPEPEPSEPPASSVPPVSSAPPVAAVPGPRADGRGSPQAPRPSPAPPAKGAGSETSSGLWPSFAEGVSDLWPSLPGSEGGISSRFPAVTDGGSSRFPAVADGGSSRFPSYTDGESSRLPVFDEEEASRSHPVLELKGWNAASKPVRAVAPAPEPGWSPWKIMGLVGAGGVLALLLAATGYMIFSGALGRLLAERLTRDAVGPIPGLGGQQGSAGADPIGGAVDGAPANPLARSMKSVLKAGAGGRPIRSLVFSPDGSRIAALDVAGGLIDWTPGVAPRGGELDDIPPRTLLGESNLTWLAFASDGRTLIAGDGWTANFWDLGADEPKQKTLGTPPPATHDHRPPMISADGARVVTWEIGGPERMKFRVWETATSEELASAEVPRFIVKTAALSPNGGALAFSHEQSVYLYDVNARQALEPIPNFEVGGGPDSPGLAFSPDGTTLAVIGHPSNVFRRQLCLWSIPAASGRAGVLAVPAGSPVAAPDEEEEAAIRARSPRLLIPPISLDRDPLQVAYTPTGRTLLLQDTKVLTVFEAGSGVVRTTIPLGTLPKLAAASNGTSVAVSLAPANFQSAQVRVWSLADGQGTQVFPQARRGVGLPSPALAYTPDCRRLAIGEGDGSITLWDLGRRGLMAETLDALAVHQIPAGHARITGLGFSPNGRWLLCNCPDADPRLFALDVETGVFTPIPVSNFLRGPSSAMFIPEEDRLLAPGPHKTAHLGSHRWSLTTGDSQPLGTLHQFAAIAIAPDGKTIAASYTIPKEGAQGIRTVLTRWPIDDPNNTPIVLSEFPARRLMFSEDGKTLAGEFLKPKQRAPIVEVWHLPDPSPLPTMQPSGVLIGVLDGGRTVATIPGGGVALGDHIQLWDTATGRSSGTIELRRGHIQSMLGFALHPNGRMFATVGGEGEILLKDRGDAEPRIGLSGLGEVGVLSVAFSPDGRFLAAGSGRGQVGIWDLEGLDLVGSSGPSASADGATP